MKIDIQRFIDNTCMECEKYNRGKFGKCQAEKEDIYRCARRKMFEFKAKNRYENPELLEVEQ